MWIYSKIISFYIHYSSLILLTNLMLHINLNKNMWTNERIRICIQSVLNKLTWRRFSLRLTAQGFTVVFFSRVIDTRHTVQTCKVSNESIKCTPYPLSRGREKKMDMNLWANMKNHCIQIERSFIHTTYYILHTASSKLMYLTLQTSYGRSFVHSCIHSAHIVWTGHRKNVNVKRKRMTRVHILWCMC